MARKNPARKVIEANKDFALTSTEGRIRECLATAKLLEAGYEVCLPVVEYRYDIVAKRDHKFMRIQVKNLKLKYMGVPEQPSSIDQYEIRAFSSPRKERATYSPEDTDFIMGINIATGKFAIVPVGEIPSSGIVNISEQSDRARYFNTFTALEEFSAGTQ